MKISNLHDKNNRGFTLIELVVVLAGLSILTSFSIPSILNSLKLNKVKEAKALMNSYAADCLSQYRMSSDTSNFIKTATPSQLDDDKLSSLQYKIDGDIITAINRRMPQWAKTHPSAKQRYKNLNKWSDEVKEKYKNFI